MKSPDSEAEVVKTPTGKACLVYRFSSERFEELSNPETNRALRPERSIRDKNGAFYGVPTVEAINLYKHGWPEGLQKTAELKSQIEGCLKSSKFAQMERTYEVYGGNPDVGAFLSGDPQNMIHREPSDKISLLQSAHKVVKIVIFGSCSAGVNNASVAMIRGSILMVIIDLLESSGFRVEVDYLVSCCESSTSKYPGYEFQWYVRVKEASQPLDHEKMAFVACHTSMERRLGLFVTEPFGFDETNAYGNPAKQESVVDRGDIFICHQSFSAIGKGLEAWAAKCLSILKDYGIEVE